MAPSGGFLLVARVLPRRHRQGTNSYHEVLRLRRLVLFSVLAVAILLPRAMPAQTRVGDLDVTTETTTFSPGFQGRLEKIVAAHNGIMGVSLKNLKTGEEICINGDELFPTASTIKLAVMVAAFDALVKGTAPFKGYYDTKVYDAATSTGGSGFIRNFKDGTKVELKELMHMMITASDNIGTNMIVEWLGSLRPVNQWLKDHGFEHTRMASTVGGRIIDDPEMRKTWGLGLTTPNEMRRLMEMILSGEAGTTSTTDEMLRLLGHQYFDDGVAAAVPPTVWVGSKSGSLSRSRSDVAIVAAPTGTYILTVFTKDNVDSSWGRKNEAEANIRKISKAIWKQYNPSDKWQRPAGAQEF